MPCRSDPGHPEWSCGSYLEIGFLLPREPRPSPAGSLPSRTSEEESSAGSLPKTLDFPPAKLMWCGRRAHSPGGPRGGLPACIVSQPDDPNHFRLSHWNVHMTWNGIQFADGVSIPEIVSFEQEEPWLHRIVPDVVPAPDVIHEVPTLRAGKSAVSQETAPGLKIRCAKQGGILEIVDPRMFRPGRETFCRAIRATAIKLGGASSVDLDLPGRSCRFHFEPDRFDEAELARRVSLAIEAATMAVQLEASGFVDGRITSVLQEPATTGGGQEKLPVATGSDRCRCMALGGGSLMAGIAGLILPRGGKGVRNHKRQGILAALGKLGPDSLLPGLADIDKPPGEVRPPRAITAENAGYLTSPDRVRSAPPGLGLVQNDRL